MQGNEAIRVDKGDIERKSECGDSVVVKLFIFV
jgi:hypothetical protein